MSTNALFLLLPLLFCTPITAQTLPPVMASEYAYEVRYRDLSDSVRLAYLDEGKDRNGTLLFLHGLGSNLQAWNKNIPGLSDRYRCLAVDLPGYGRSLQEEHPGTMSFYAEQVAAFVASLRLTSVTLVGHSMGGQIALEVASRQPEWLVALVLAAPAGLETFSEADRRFFATYTRPEVIVATPPEQIERNFDLNFYGGTPADARFMVDDRLLLRQDTAAYAYYTRLISGSVSGMLAGPVLDKIGRIRVPTLIVFGSEDRLIPNRLLHPHLSVEQVAGAGLERIPDARLILLERAGHFVQWDRAEVFNAALGSFLTGE